MATIQELVLVISRTSTACIPVVEQAIAMKLPVNIISLDSKAERTVAIESDRVKIDAVPSLIVRDSGGKVNVFKGQEKCLLCLKQVYAFRSGASQRSDTSPALRPDGDITRREHERRTKGRPQKAKRIIEPEEPAEIVLIDELDTDLIATKTNVFSSAAEMSKRRDAALAKEAKGGHRDDQSE